MTKPWITTTTGICLPESVHYQPYKSDETARDALLNPMTGYDKDVTAYYERHSTQLSQIANALLASYAKQDSYANFMAMVDFACEVLGGDSCTAFFNAQCANPHISSTTLQLLRDAVTGNVQAIGKSYQSVANASRFVRLGSIPPGEEAKRRSFLFNGVAAGQLNWCRLLLPLVVDRKAFLSLYRHLFVDFY